jgi:hypothetical protein
VGCKKGLIFFKVRSYADFYPADFGFNGGNTISFSSRRGLGHQYRVKNWWQKLLMFYLSQIRKTRLDLRELKSWAGLVWILLEANRLQYEQHLTAQSDSL